MLWYMYFNHMFLKMSRSERQMILVYIYMYKQHITISLSCTHWSPVYAVINPTGYSAFFVVVVADPNIFSLHSFISTSVNTDLEERSLTKSYVSAVLCLFTIIPPPPLPKFLLSYFTFLLIIEIRLV